jgi:cell division initiation protein
MSQRLTPVDILNLRFNRRVSGYAIPEVDDFVRRVASDMEALLSEGAAQRERLLAQERELTQYREIEVMMRDALVLAQKAADETRTSARREADVTLHEAQARTRELDAQTQTRLAEVEVRIDRLVQERRRLARELRTRLTAQLAWLDEEMAMPGADPQGVVSATPTTEPVRMDYAPEPTRAVIVAGDRNGSAENQTLEIR